MENLDIKRHSLAHVLAEAVLELYPDTKFATGPAIENGFYYDFDFGEKKLEEREIKDIQKKMLHIMKQGRKFEKTEKSIAEAKEFFSDQPYKLHLIEKLEAEGESKVGIYTSGNFADLCAGPHLESSKEIQKGSWSLDRIAGAYFLGDEKNQMLTRIYGLAFETADELKDFKEKREQAKKRDHKILGKKLDLFSFHPESPGCAHWHPRGMALWNTLENFGRSLRKQGGFQEIKTPVFAKNTLWKTSGHWDHYADGMFHFQSGDEDYCIKPMDCPFDIQVYQTQKRSYRDLPLRYFEIGRVFRHEQSGELNGLFRVQEITQDDSHIMCREDQIQTEIKNLLSLVKIYYKAMNLKPEFFLSTRPENFMGEIPVWDKAEQDLRDALESEDIEYGIKDKDGAFYGPKIDVNIKDAMGRTWQVATIQLDFQLPGRFDCVYTDSDGGEKTPVMIHAAIFGSFERMTGILIEHFGAEFPLWLAPVQARIVPVSDNFMEYAKQVRDALVEAGIRVELDETNESLGKRIRNAEMAKPATILVLGEQEMNAKSVTIRRLHVEEQETKSLDDFIAEVKKAETEK